MSVVTRFAPSPTGRLHVGNLRTALVNWLVARQAGGRFLLRLDDTDAARSTDAFAEAIRDDLRWAGLTWDGEARQSNRGDLYEARFAALRDAGRVYPAWETAEELELKRRIARSRGAPPVYDRAALRLSEAEKARMETPPHWRFRLDHDAAIEWTDLVRGPQRIDPALQSDPVVRRADGSWLYLLPSVIDDVEMGVTHVVRGEDHVTNTGLQVQMFAALGAPPPAFGHLALLTGGDEKLSKRLGSVGVEAFRAAGVEPAAVTALLARLGTSDPVVPTADLATLADTLDLARFGRAPARFDEAELAAVNARLVHALPFETVAHRLPAGMDRAAWEAVRPNLATVSQAAEWWSVIAGEVPPPDPAEADYLARAAALATEVDWSADPWHALTERLKAETGRKGRPLFQPLRLALTGRESGPDMAALLPLIGRDRALARLRGG